MPTSGHETSRDFAVVAARRLWSGADKQSIVDETLVPGANVSAVARRHGVAQSLLYRWRKDATGLLSHLPRERVMHRVAAACPCCGGQLRKLGEDVTETLELVPASWKVIQHVREKFSCRQCETITQAPAPNHPIARGRAGPQLLVPIQRFIFAQSVQDGHDDGFHGLPHPSGFAVDNWTETAKHSRRREGLPRAQFDYLTLLFKHVRIPAVS